jgi:undecaprenyl-diphosphatase
MLGIIQGLTEWLPISSTGHLRLAEHVIGLDVPVLFDVALHVGTLIVVLFFFRREVWKMGSALVHFNLESESGKTVPLIIAGVIPTLIIGLIFGTSIEGIFGDIVPIAIAFIICGSTLLAVRLSEDRTEEIRYSTAIIMGVAQGLAIIPGLSRSGLTIAVALMLGVKRRKAFSFSFLISIPAILGALAFTSFTQFAELAAAGLEWSELIAGVFAAILVGYFALKLLQKTIMKKKLYLFAFYCWTVGAAIILISGIL